MSFQFKKSLGQNFLKDQKVLDQIQASVSVQPEDLIIEIGPGAGALTKRLKEFHANLICFEVDENTKQFLLPLEDEKTKIIYQDFMQVDLNKILSDMTYEKLYFIANLPYYITTPILEKIISSDVKPDEMVFMVQKEVAERFTAKPKTKSYGSFTVFLNYYFTIEKLFDVSRNSFVPVPNVDSAVVKLKRREDSWNVQSESQFFKLVRESFIQKRKTLRKNLTEHEWKIVKSILEKYGYSETVRAEEIPIEIFIEMSNAL